MWYPTLWKENATYHFYEVHNAFVSSSKKIIFGFKTLRIYLEMKIFLDTKGSIEVIEHYSVIIIYCSWEKPLYLFYYVSDNIFSIKLCRQYIFWAHLFHVKTKKQFLPFPWRIGEILLRIISNIDDFQYILTNIT